VQAAAFRPGAIDCVRSHQRAERVSAGASQPREAPISFDTPLRFVVRQVNDESRVATRGAFANALRLKDDDPPLRPMRS